MPDKRPFEEFFERTLVSFLEHPGPSSCRLRLQSRNDGAAFNKFTVYSDEGLPSTS